MKWDCQHYLWQKLYFSVLGAGKSEILSCFLPMLKLRSTRTLCGTLFVQHVGDLAIRVIAGSQRKV